AKNFHAYRVASRRSHSAPSVRTLHLCVLSSGHAPHLAPLLEHFGSDTGGDWPPHPVHNLPTPCVLLQVPMVVRQRVDPVALAGTDPDERRAFRPGLRAGDVDHERARRVDAALAFYLTFVRALRIFDAPEERRSTAHRGAAALINGVLSPDFRPSPGVSGIGRESVATEELADLLLRLERPEPRLDFSQAIWARCRGGPAHEGEREDQSSGNPSETHKILLPECVPRSRLHSRTRSSYQL